MKTIDAMKSIEAGDGFDLDVRLLGESDLALSLTALYEELRQFVVRNDRFPSRVLMTLDQAMEYRNLVTTARWSPEAPSLEELRFDGKPIVIEELS